jgi:hypothetical protein
MEAFSMQSLIAFGAYCLALHLLSFQTMHQVVPGLQFAKLLVALLVENVVTEQHPGYDVKTYLFFNGGSAC